MPGVGSFSRALARLRSEERGFTVLEAAIAMGLILMALMGLLYTVGLGFNDIAYARQRQVGAELANRAAEEVRSLTYTTVSQGLAASDLSGDPDIVSCPGGTYSFR